MTELTKWDKRMLLIAKEVSTWSKDPKRKVGCVITTLNYRIVSTGYNGYLESLDDNDQTDKLLKTIHAEVNAATSLSSSHLNILYRVFVYGGHPCSSCVNALLRINCRHFVVPEVEQNSKWTENWKLAEKIIKIHKTSFPITYKTYSSNILN